MRVSSIRKIKAERKVFFTIVTKQGTTKLRMDEIDYFEKDLRQIRVHSIKGVYSFYGSFKNLEEKIDDRFCRCHNSFMVNLDKITRIERRTLLLENGETISVSQRFYPHTRIRYLNN